MKSLAQFIVKSPGQSALVAGLATASLLLSWVGAAALALYALRFGLAAATPVFIVALLPAGFWALAGDIGPLLTLCGALGLALLLRLRSSWADLLSVLPFAMAALCLLVLVVAPDYVQGLQAMASAFVEQFQQQLVESGSTDTELLTRLQNMPTPGASQLMGMMALMQSTTVLVSLLLARWWQAMLFNPGGFRQEFHSLRLGRIQVLVLVACFVGLVGNEAHAFWAWVFVVPIIVAGIALVHGLVGIAGAASRWLIMFYAALLLFRPAFGLLVALAVMDCALDFRRRLQQSRAG